MRYVTVSYWLTFVISLCLATLQVPRNYEQPNGEKLPLRLVRQPAKKGTKNPLSVIMNPGGPGSSGINQVVGSKFNGGEQYQNTIGDNFHIIGFDPRYVLRYGSCHNPDSHGTAVSASPRSTNAPTFRAALGKTHTSAKLAAKMPSSLAQIKHKSAQRLCISLISSALLSPHATSTLLLKRLVRTA